MKHVPSADLLKNYLPLHPSESNETESISAAPSSYSHNHVSHTDEEISADTDHLNCRKIAIKILVTNEASGYIIGRNGKTILEFQTRSNTRIKLSQSGEYYPGTNVPNRVCLIQGTVADTKVALEMIFLKLYELQNAHETVPLRSGEFDCQRELSESFSVRLLVPTTFCGMLIGRFGSNIKQLKEDSGVTLIQLSQKGNDDVVPAGGSSLSALTSERIMTIAGPNFKSCLHCVQSVLTNMASNPELSRYVNMTTRYSKVTFPVHTASQRHEVADHHRQSLGPQWQYPGSYNLSTAFDPSMHGLCLDTLPACPSHIPVETAGLSPTQSMSGLHGPALQDDLTPSGLITPVNDLTELFQDQSLGLFSRQRSSHGISHDVTCEFGIPENMVGSILGRGGTILNELQMQSKTKIRLSQRGEFFPGTNQRIVIITGPSTESLASAQYLIRERMSANRPHLK